MTFPSDYKVVQQAGESSGVVGDVIGKPRQLLVDTTKWQLLVMDGVNPGGHPVVMLSDFANLFLDSDVIPQGTKTAVEVAVGTDADSIAVKPWSPLVIRTLFEKIADTATAGSWFVKNSAMPDRMRNTGKNLNDLNNGVQNGFYTADPTSVLNLPGGVSTSSPTHVAIIVEAQSVDNVMQMLIERNGSGRIWIRVRLDGIWNAWVLASGVTSAELALKMDKAGGAFTGPVDFGGFAISEILSVNGGNLQRMNHVVNGDFLFNQYANANISLSGFGVFDRFLHSHNGTTKVASIGAGIVGDSFHGYTQFLRTTVTSVAGVSNYCSTGQRLEDVSKLAGRRVTIAFEAKADSAKDMAVSMSQNFGTGGSPSAPIAGIGGQRVTLSTDWQYFKLIIDLPSVLGKILGTDNNDYTGITLWYDAGSNFNGETANLGQQSGVFDIRHLSVTVGDHRSEANPFGEWDREQEFLRCQRFYERIAYRIYNRAENPAFFGYYVKFISKHSVPALTRLNEVYSNCEFSSYQGLTEAGVAPTIGTSTAGTCSASYILIANSEII